MKVVSHMNLFGLEIDWEYNGMEDEIKHNGMLYLPVETAQKYYIVRPKWIEVINDEVD